MTFLLQILCHGEQIEPIQIWSWALLSQFFRPNWSERPGCHRTKMQAICHVPQEEHLSILTSKSIRTEAFTVNTGCNNQLSRSVAVCCCLRSGFWQSFGQSVVSHLPILHHSTASCPSISFGPAIPVALEQQLAVLQSHQLQLQIDIAEPHDAGGHISHLLSRLAGVLEMA